MIRFLTTRNVLAVDMHCQCCEVYGSNANAMSDSKVRYWLRQLKDGCENVHNESRSGQPYLNHKLFDYCSWFESLCCRRFTLKGGMIFFFSFFYGLYIVNWLKVYKNVLKTVKKTKIKLLIQHQYQERSKKLVYMFIFVKWLKYCV